MMKAAENPKMDLASSCEAMGAGIISLSDHVNGFHYATDKSDSCVIDMESLPHGHGPNKDINQNSRITRSLSRKGSQRGEKKMNCSSPVSERDSLVPSSSPGGTGSPEKSMVVTGGGTDQPSSPQVHHITVTTSSITSASESRYVFRRNSFRRSQAPWLLDPKRVLFFFATLSSMGTILLIYFTLSINKMSGEDDPLSSQP